MTQHKQEERNKENVERQRVKFCLLRLRLIFQSLQQSTERKSVQLENHVSPIYSPIYYQTQQNTEC